MKSGSQASWWKQLSTLLRRSSLNMSRDVGYYWLRIIIYILVSICVGTIYFDVGKGYTAIFARAACGAFITGFMTFMSIGGFPSFIEEMKVNIAHTETSVHMYIFCCVCTKGYTVEISVSYWLLILCFLLVNRCFIEKDSMGIMEFQCSSYPTSSLHSHSWL